MHLFTRHNKHGIASDAGVLYKQKMCINNVQKLKTVQSLHEIKDKTMKTCHMYTSLFYKHVQFIKISFLVGTRMPLVFTTNDALGFCQ